MYILNLPFEPKDKNFEARQYHIHMCSKTYATSYLTSPL